jgi:molybdopterin-guanine dinucleotide biosynthesis protein A
MTLTAILFAGGESRRMGTDKATLLFQGEPLWSRQLQTLRALNPAKILISARSQPSWQPADVETVLDEVSGQGPLGGLTAALAAMKTTHLLALAVDLPQMTSTHLESLWKLAGPGCGVVPRSASGLEPLCAVYPAESLSAARSTLSSGEPSMHRFINTLADCNQVRFHDLANDDLPLYRNLNTPADFPDFMHPPA